MERADGKEESGRRLMESEQECSLWGLHRCAPAPQRPNAFDGGKQGVPGQPRPI